MISENEVIQKMKDLQDSLNVMFKYSKMRSKFHLLLLLILVGILFSALLILIADYLDYLNYSPNLANFIINSYLYMNAGVVILFFWIFYLIILYYILNKELKKGPYINWENDLNEGIIGALKIIQREDWDKIIENLKKAKKAFIVYSLFQIIIYWIPIFIITFIGMGFLLYIFNINILLNSFFYVIPIISLLIMFPIFGDEISNIYSKLWNIDDLITELRWLYLEFQRASF